MFSDIFKYMFFSVHKDGLPFVGILLVLSFICYFISNALFSISVILALCCALFFRDPVRVTTEEPYVIVSPADGVITKIEQVKTPEDFGFVAPEMQRISIFLSVFDVHINRIPIEGTIIKTQYHPGKFVSATLDKSSTDNERQFIAIHTHHLQEIGVVQIAGLIARRIVCNLQELQKVNKGESFGIIRFGSRVDLYLPLGIKIAVLEGQSMIGGETVIGRLEISEIAIETGKVKHGKNKNEKHANL